MLNDSIPLVSCILLTTHPRRERFLPDALRSYRQQTYPARELVVVNDGDPLASAAPDIRVINLPSIGRRWTIGEKRNVGVRTARGEFIATWDDDDISLPHRLSAQIACAQECGAHYVLADKMHIADEDMNVMGNCDRGASRSVMPSALISRDAVVAVGGYSPSDYREDVELLFRIRWLCRGTVIRMNDCDWYVLRRHASNITLSHGESNETYLQCGLRGSGEQTAAEAVARLRASPGGLDVVSAGG